MKPISILIILFFCFLETTGVFGQERVYTWTDENGVVHISNRKPGRNVKVQDVDHYKASKQRDVKGTSPDVVKKAELTESQTRIKAAEEKAREAEKKAEEARKFAEKARKAADEFRDKLGAKKKRWRKNRSKMKKLDEQAKQAEQQAKAAAEIAWTAREAAEALLKQAGEAEKTAATQRR